MPLFHVCIVVITTMAIVIGSQPPSRNLWRVATKNVASTLMKTPQSASDCQSGQRQRRRVTRKKAKVVTTIVPVTAMP